MKPLDKCTNVEKAKLLHQLFPNEIPNLLQFVQGIAQSIKEDEESSRQAWKNGLFTFDFWLSLVVDVETRIEKYGDKLYNSSSLFADQLFDSFLSYFMTYSLILFTTIQQHPNKDFTKAVDLLFNV